MKVTAIGSCKGCTRRAILDDGVCTECLTGPRRGRKWAMMSERVRNNPEFAQTVYNGIENDKGRGVFIRMYGLPDGCTPPSPELSLVR